MTGIYRQASIGAAAALVLGAFAAQASARDMRVSSFEPPQGFFSKQIALWIDGVNAKLSADNKFKLYPGGILGAPPAQGELVKKGVADVAFVVTTYTPGVFPGTSVVEVPNLVTTAKGGTNILNKLVEDGTIAGEYKDYKIIALFSTRGYRVFLRAKDAKSPADLKGMKICTPSPFASRIAYLLGASGVSVPAPQVYENLERGVVDGAFWVFDAYKTFRLNEVAPHITTTTLTATPLAILMNKNTYNSLPEADRKVIDAMSGRTQSEVIAKAIDDFGEATEKEFRASGKLTFTDLDAAAKAEWDKALAGASDDWIKAVQQFGLDGKPVLEKAKGLAEKN